MNRVLNLVLGLVKWPVAVVALALLPGAVLALKTESELARDSFDAIAPFLTGMGGYAVLGFSSYVAGQCAMGRFGQPWNMRQLTFSSLC